MKKLFYAIIMLVGMTCSVQADVVNNVEYNKLVSCANYAKAAGDTAKTVVYMAESFIVGDENNLDIQDMNDTKYYLYGATDLMIISISEDVGEPIPDIGQMLLDENCPEI